MTPAIRALERASVPHRVLTYAHDPAAPAYGLEAAEALGLDPAHVFKTLVARVEGVTRGGGLAVGLVPVARQLDLKALAQALGGKRAELADPAAAERVTGYVVGGISPIGQKRALPTVLDASALALPELFVSGGRRGLEVALAPGALVALLDALARPIAR